MFIPDRRHYQRYPQAVHICLIWVKLLRYLLAVCLPWYGPSIRSCRMRVCTILGDPSGTTTLHFAVCPIGAACSWAPHAIHRQRHGPGIHWVVQKLCILPELNWQTVVMWGWLRRWFIHQRLMMSPLTRPWSKMPSNNALSMMSLDWNCPIYSYTTVVGIPY
jgi:hypothetical protein